jgi:hypothetical protein
VGAFPAEPRTRADRLRTAAMRLAAELDEARLYQAAAYASMAADSIGEPAVGRAAEGEGGSRIQVRDDGRGTEVDLDFTLDGQGRVWMIREGDCHILGRTEPVCATMRRFLAGVASGGDGYG